MNLRKRNFLKITAAALLLLLAASLTALLNAALSARNPVNALPSMEVIYKEAPLPYEYTTTSSFSWRFMVWTRSGSLHQADFWRHQLSAAPVVPNTALQLQFSHPAKSVAISVASGDTDTFIPLEGELRTPSAPGVYTYRVEASWGWRGSVLYYFKIDVRV